jgi:hypothetical protein
MKKADAEKIFVGQIKQVGIKAYGKTYERGNWYWFFDLLDGARRYWTNLSDDNARELGIDIDLESEE